MNARLATLTLLALAAPAAAQEKLLPQDFDYAAAMKKVAGRFKGRPGVVLHVGDSITYSNPYRSGRAAARARPTTTRPS